MGNSIIRAGAAQSVGLGLLCVFLTYAASVILGGPLFAVLGFCVFGVAWFAAVTAESRWIRIAANSLIFIATVLVIAIAAIFAAIYA